MISDTQKAMVADLTKNLREHPEEWRLGRPEKLWMCWMILLYNEKRRVALGTPRNVTLVTYWDGESVTSIPIPDGEDEELVIAANDALQNIFRLKKKEASEVTDARARTVIGRFS